MLLKIFWNFRNASKKNQRLEAAVLKCSTRYFSSKIRKIHKKTPVIESLCNKSFRIKKIQKIPAQVYSCEFWETFKNTFFTEHLPWSWSLSLKKLCNVGVHKKAFQWLAANKFLPNSKHYLRFSCISISCFSILASLLFFLRDLCFFFSPQHEERSNQSNYQEVVAKKWGFCIAIIYKIVFTTGILRWTIVWSVNLISRIILPEDTSISVRWPYFAGLIVSLTLKNSQVFMCLHCQRHSL